MPSDVAWAMIPPSTDPTSIAAPEIICPRPRTDFETALVVGVTQCVDKPSFDGAGEEGEPQPDQHRHDGPCPKGGADLPHEVVEKGRCCERQGAEKV